ncbi:peptide chain release factor N(5)-glutamine methyltransferase [Roseomonas sp. PWR1]|uniref:Release factor glutamine methyltransferase n=1 Tax=Roseomonas nitratireducens TaxID=2820810 RepID=A0ABS4B1P1_9PROT|nr:peptide chain release factor N(5)-glutamine methyltransferase [Neoroseomonas nitratireducens]MBP0466993.1 peptide chain release factor N(5)-glutamine methyltransferase [Neoroseomonas nitratireducens]
MSGCADPGGSVGAFLCQAGQVLRAAGLDAPRLEARRLLSHAMGCTEEALLRDPRAPVPADAVAAFGAMLARRAAREPLALILGRAGFWTLDLEVCAATLVPRADSEAVVEAALAAFAGPEAVRRVLDLGTGTGALLLAVLAEFPQAFGVGVDLAPDAAALAARNAAANGLAGRAAFLAGRWAESLIGRFDLVLSNPPYIPGGEIAALMPEVARHEPRLALDGGPDGLDAYRAILAALPALLAQGGRAVLEIGQGQRDAVESLARAGGLLPLGARADLGGIDRALVFGA